jgi:uncharacterized protein YaiE (UPF0345 family)
VSKGVNNTLNSLGDNEVVIMNAEQARITLEKKWPTAEDLRKAHPDISHLLEGKFLPGKFNIYEFPEGVVVSRPLVQSAEGIIFPTVGIISPYKDHGQFTFNTGRNVETMIVLEGMLTANIDDESSSILGQYGAIITPAGSDLNLSTPQRVFYLCQYEPKK